MASNTDMLPAGHSYLVVSSTSGIVKARGVVESRPLEKGKPAMVAVQVPANHVLVTYNGGGQVVGMKASDLDLSLDDQKKIEAAAPKKASSSPTPSPSPSPSSAS